MTSRAANNHLSRPRLGFLGAGLCLSMLAVVTGCGDRAIGDASGLTDGADDWGGDSDASDTSDTWATDGDDGHDDGHDEDGGMTGPPLDLPGWGGPTAPTIESTYPAANATGVRSDVEIVVHFSEPMDLSATEAAFVGEGLGPVSFDWNSQGDTLTITPHAPLAYAQGKRPDDVSALVYGVSFGLGARDAEGDPLAQPARFEFLTLREFTTDLISPADLTGSVRNDGGDMGTACVVGDGQVQFDGHDIWYRCGISMMLARIADGAEIAHAELSFTYKTIFGDGVSPGDPFASLGALRLLHVHFDEKTVASFSQPGELVGSWVSADPTSGPTTVDVTTWLAEDFEAEASGGYSQYRLEFEAFDDGDSAYDLVVIEPWQLEVRYLLP